MEKLNTKQYVVACYFAALDNFKENPFEVWAADYFLASYNRMKRVLTEAGENGHPAAPSKMLAAAKALISYTRAFFPDF